MIDLMGHGLSKASKSQDKIDPLKALDGYVSIE